MWERLASLSRFIAVSLGFGLVVAQVAVSAQTDGKGTAPGREDALVDSAGELAARMETTPSETYPLVILGCVVDQDGAPCEGAVVVSSAGGRALTDARGDFRLEVDAPLD